MARDNAARENTPFTTVIKLKLDLRRVSERHSSFKERGDTRGSIFIPTGFTPGARIKTLYSEELSVLLSNLICSPAMDLCIPE